MIVTQMDPGRVFVGHGATTRYALDNAMSVAVALFNAGVWDGVSLLTVHHPEVAYKRAVYSEGSIRQVLTPGVDYEIERGEDYGEPLVPEPRVVNRDLYAITAHCRHCGGQYDYFVNRVGWEYGETRYFRYAAQTKCCPICDRIRNPEQYGRPALRPAPMVQPVGPTVTYHLVQSEADVARFFRQHGDDVGALQMTIVAMQDSMDTLREELEAKQLELALANAAAAWIRIDAQAVLDWYTRNGLMIAGATPHRALAATLKNTDVGRALFDEYMACVGALEALDREAPEEEPLLNIDAYQDADHWHDLVVDHARWACAEIARKVLRSLTFRPRGLTNDAAAVSGAVDRR